MSRVAGAAIDRLTTRVRRLGRLAGALQDLAVDLSDELSIVRRTLAADASGRLDAAVACAILRSAHARHQASLRAAVAGAWKMETRRHGRAAVMIRIDEGEWFRVGESDAQIVRMLVDVPPERDGFPTWQTYGRLVARIRRETGRRRTHRAIVESVYRLRRAFRRADLNPFLLQVDRRKGLRLLLHQLSGSTSIPDPVADEDGRPRPRP